MVYENDYQLRECDIQKRKMIVSFRVDMKGDINDATYTCRNR